MKKTFTIAGLGELLWDVFPTHKRIGGAPANFAWHCSQIGAEAYPVTCIGTDALGQEMSGVLEDLGVATQYVLQSEQYPTGTVQVSLDAQGKPSYEICEGVAWDHLSYNAQLEELAGRLDAVCFGSLCQRSPESRSTIRKFIEQMPAGSMKIFDVNFRQSYYSKELVQESLELATVLKLSDEELEVLIGYFDLSGDLLEQLQQLRARFDLQLLVYTRGAEGSLLITADEINDTPGRPIKAVDSVGAGDSFTASMCMGMLSGWPLSQVNEFANQVAAFVCSNEGATPQLPDALKLSACASS